MTYKADIGDDITSGLVNTFADNSPYVPLFNLQQHACVCTHNTYTQRCCHILPHGCDADSTESNINIHFTITMHTG